MTSMGPTTTPMTTTRAAAAVPARRRAAMLWLYFRAISKEFRWTLLALLLAISLGAVLYGFAPDPTTPRRLTPGDAVYRSWCALLGEPTMQSPPTWYIAVMQALYPLIGFALIGEGVVRFALIMLSKRHGEKEWMKVMASTYRDHVVLCGLGKLGIRVLEHLVASGIPVVVLERDPDNRFLERAKGLGAPVLMRDMKEDQSLIDAQIGHARAVIIATNDDMANLEVALDARRLNPKVRVVMRLFDQQIAAKISGALMVDAAFSSSSLAAPIVAALSMETNVLSSSTIHGVPHVTCELTVEPRGVLAGRSVADVERKFAVRILSRTAADSHRHAMPTPDIVLRPGDVVVVHAPTAQLSSLSAEAAQTVGA
jgi:voltage-gated potassium channel Kch